MPLKTFGSDNNTKSFVPTDHTENITEARVLTLRAKSAEETNKTRDTEALTDEKGR